MAVDEAARHQLYTRLTETLGDQPTSTLMSLLPPIGWSDVATRDDLHALESTLRGEMAELRGELRGEMAELRAGLRGEMAELRAGLRGEMAELRAEFADLRGEFTGLRGGFTELRGEVATEIAGLESRLTTALRHQLFALIGVMVMVSGLTVGAAAALV